MNANNKSNIIAIWLWQGFSAVFILAFVTSVLAQTPTLRANGKIAFTSDRDGNPEIYVMNPDGTNQTRLTNNSIVDDHAMWSPDGEKLAFVSQRATGGFAIFQMNMDGTDRVEITPLSNFVNAPPFGAVGFSMSWSPDGRKIAFQDPYYNDIWVVDVETHARQNLTNDGGGQVRFFDYNPAWSPDGSTILFSSPRDVDPCTTLYTINPDGTNRRLLSPNHCPAYSPSWSPDGNKFVFVQLNGEFVESELRIANSDGTNVRIFDGGYPDINNRDYPRWSPDGRKIAFNMTNSQDIEIYVKNIDGTGYAQLTNTPAGLNYRPSWQPLVSAACPNPIDCADFFVRQHYRDFLSREPEAGEPWTGILTGCPDQFNQDPASPSARCDRLTVSAAFFGSPEFRLKGSYVFTFYRVAFDRLADFDEIVADMHSVTGQTPADTFARRAAFPVSFIGRPEFRARFDSLSDAAFVAALLDRYGLTAITTPDPQQPESGQKVTLTRADLTSLLGGGALTRAQVLRAVVESDEVSAAEFNRAFVAMQYYGYLRRTPEAAGYNDWLSYLTAHPTDFRTMVHGFVNSIEYRMRFGQP